MSRPAVQTYNLTKEQEEAIRKSFEAIDSDKNGYLTYDEMNRFMTENHFGTQFLNAIFKVFDKNGDRQLTFSEFMEYIEACNRTATDRTYLYKLIFDAIDADHNGALNVAEMLEFGSLIGINLTREDAERELKEMDTDNSGDISFPEICKALGL